MNTEVLPPFVGHSYPGVLLIILGTWWAINIWREYFVSRNHSRLYRSTASFVIRSTRRTVCVDGVYKVAVGAFGMVNYGWMGISHGRITNTSEVQHMTLFLLYGLSGLLDLLTASNLPMPDGTDYVGLLLTFSAQGLLFHFHLHDRSSMDVLTHTLFVYCFVAAAVCVSIEMVLRRSVLAALGRAFFTILQGTWVIQIAFILYNPWSDGQSWKDDHQGLMLAVAVYTWHLIGIVGYLGLLGGLTGHFMCGLRCDKTREQHIRLLHDSATD